MSDDSASAPVLLYDGTCGFCAASVQFVLRRDRKGTMRFAALESAFGRAVAGRHPGLRGFDSMVYLEPAHARSTEKVFTHSDAGLRVAQYLGGGWRLLAMTRVVPAFVRDAVYRLVARHRHRLSASRLTCVVPPPEHRSRFLD